MESPSVSVMANGRTIGRLAAFMANGGSLNGQCMFNDEGWNALHGEKTKSPFFGPMAVPMEMS